MKHIRVEIKCDEGCQNELAERLAEFHFELTLTRAMRLTDEAARRQFIEAVSNELEIFMEKTSKDSD